jgi:heptosyltransferase-1
MLIVRVGAMGDVLHALPAVAALRRAQPEWWIDWVVDDRWQPLLDSDVRGPIVDVAFRVPIREWKRAPFAASTRRSLLEFKNLRGRYDFVVDMQGTLRSAVIGWLAGKQELAGYCDPRESFAKWLYRKKLQRRGAHVVEQNAALLGEACGIALKPAAVQLPHTAWADDWAAEFVGDRKVCLLAASAGWGAKQWPAERYGALARELRDMGFVPLVNAPKKDDAVAASVVAASGGAAETVVCNVAGLIALMRKTSLLVGGDSGPTHLAAALGIPLVALYGPTDPARNGPWGTGPMRVMRGVGSVTSHKRVAEIDAGLARTTVEEVSREVKELVG